MNTGMSNHDVFVTARLARFADQVERRLAGEITEEQFRPLSLMNGVTLHSHSYSLRVVVPYRVLDARQLRMLAHVARRYDKGYCHFTAHGTVEFHWPVLADIPAMLSALASVGMHAAQPSGEYPQVADGAETAAHRHADHEAVTIALGAASGTQGDASAGQLEAVADLAERYGFDEVRVSPEQTLILPSVARADLKTVHDALAGIDMAKPIPIGSRQSGEAFHADEAKAA